MNATYGVGGSGSEHVHKRQRQRPTLQLSVLHPETRSHDVANSSSLVEIDPGLRNVVQEVLHKNACGSYGTAHGTREPALGDLVDDRRHPSPAAQAADRPA